MSSKLHRLLRPAAVAVATSILVDWSFRNGLYLITLPASVVAVCMLLAVIVLATDPPD